MRRSKDKKRNWTRRRCSCCGEMELAEGFRGNRCKQCKGALSELGRKDRVEYYVRHTMQGIGPRDY